MRSRHRLAAACLAAAILASACTDGAPDPDPTTPTVEPTTQTAPTDTATETEAPTEIDFTLPDQVTTEYVDLVVNTLYEEWGAIHREVLSQPPDQAGATQQLKDRTAAIFSGQMLLQRLDELDETARGGREGLLPPEEFTQVVASMRQIKRGDATCVVAVGDLNFDGTAVDAEHYLAGFSLEPATGMNVTGWKLIDVLPNFKDGEPLPDAALLENDIATLEPVLGNSCGEES